MKLGRQLKFDFMREKSLSQKLLEMGTMGLLGAIGLGTASFPFLMNAYGPTKFEALTDYGAAGLFMSTGIAITSLIPFFYKQNKYH